MRRCSFCETPLDDGEDEYTCCVEGELFSWATQEVARIEADSRFQAKPALVQVNAPLALIQVELKAMHAVFSKLLERLR